MFTKGESPDFGPVWKEGDLVELKVDKEKGRLSIKHNGQNIGFTFDERLPIMLEKMFFFVNFYSSADEVEI